MPRVGIIGGGFMGAVHARAARAAGARIEAIVSSSPAATERAARSLGVEPARSVAELVASERVDIVHVCTPNSLHHEHAMAAMAAGKHVVCEKPLATAWSDAAAMVRSVDRLGLVATLPFVYRFHPMVREMRERIGRGDIGDILTIEASYLQDWLLHADDDNWRVDPSRGGRSRAFGDIGSHLVDLIEFVTGTRIVRLVATVRTFLPERSRHRGISTEDAVSVAFETDGGAIGALLVSQMVAGRKNRPHLEVAGSSGSLRIDLEHPEELWLGRREGVTVLARDPERLSGDARRLSLLPAGHPQGFQDAFNGFARDTYEAVVSGTAPQGLPAFPDGLRALQLTEAVLSSGSQGVWVRTPIEEVAAVARAGSSVLA